MLYMLGKNSVTEIYAHVSLLCVCVGGASTRACAHAHEYEAQRLMPGAPSTTFHLFILRKIYLFLFYVWVFCLHICLCTTNAHSALG